MNQEWSKLFENPLKLAVAAGAGMAVFFLLWGALVVACIVGVLIAIYKYDVRAGEAIIAGIWAYFVIKGLAVVWFEGGGIWFGGESAEERQRFEALTPEEQVAERKRRRLARLTRWAIFVVVGLCAYLIYK